MPSAPDLTDEQADVLRAGLAELRDLPWRRTRDPWSVLVSEVMLQQTQVARVVPRWARFLARWPTPAACAAAPLGDVLTEWQGLGYPRRARNLWLTATACVEQHGGRLPTELDALLALPGIGAYTARAVLAFALEALDPQVRREEALRRIFRLPLLARIPSERRGRRTSSPLLVDDLSPSAREGYRMLRVAFDARQRRGRSHSVLVTSSGHSEGKSTTALNLATSLAAVGHSVILIEADLRRPSLRRGLGLPPSVGVAGVLMSEVDFEEALLDVPDTDGDLRLLLAEESAGYLADSPLAAGITDVIARAGELCDYVVVDAPPATEVSDVIPIAQAVDDVIVVARIGRSRTDRLEQLGELLARHGIRPVGIVVVGAERTRDSGYYAETTPARKARKRGRGSDLPAARS